MSGGMRIRVSIAAFALALAGCGGGNHTRGVNDTPPPSTGGGQDLSATPAPDMGGVMPPVSADMASAPPAGDDHGDGGAPGSLGDGGVFVPPPADMGTVSHGPPITNGHFTIYGTGGDFRDVSTDQGGGIWATTSAAVYYFVGGKTFTYDQSSGLAEGKTTWTDTYWFGSDTNPSTQNVVFTSVAGGMPGQVFVGHVGYIADRLDVDPSTGAVRDVVGMQVTSTQQPDATELQAQQVREVAEWKVAVDLNGPMNGRAYMGGFHGLSAYSGMENGATSGLCGQGCPQFEEHIHPFTPSDTAGRDIRALAITAMGDVWVGDADFVWFEPQRSAGADADFFQNPQIPGQSATYLDIFPGTPDMVFGIAVDAAGGVWVASYGNGLAYLAPGSYAPTYWSASNALPSNYLTGVAVDGNGDVWVATQSAGAARLSPSTNTWSYVTTASGLPSNDLRAVWVDKYQNPKAVYFATDNGVAVYTP